MTLRAADLIIKKRDGKTLERDEIAFFIDGLVRGDVPDYQVSAFLMAVYFRGMSFAELAALTDCMMRSGEVIDLRSVPGVKVDKHSTGGVGDKVSLVLAPLVAAAGAKVPMVSGRGLGHTGGTLDKLEAIPGFRTCLAAKEFRRQVAEIGCAIIGQSNNFVPADKKLYALRDVTGTIDSIPLIAASIVSKKAASGADALVMDVKSGNGAFMQDSGRAKGLGKTLVRLGRELGKKVVALITDMNQPLGFAVGNSLEVIEAIETLKNRGPQDVQKLCLRLAAEMLLLAGLSRNLEDAGAKLRAALQSGAALRTFARMVEYQGGNRKIIEDYALLDVSPKRRHSRAKKSGYVEWIDTRAIGQAAMALGAGRERLEDAVDPGVGIIMKKKIGDRVASGETVLELYYREAQRLRAAETILAQAIRLGRTPRRAPRLIKSCWR
jgi:pyrimidine-nucleoside phosphorylase